ncbi:hypothetical protein [Limnoglobus roseus]|uniref:Uncharacterized protein n=1 Tax=Limnoglobus roseus TaxID=2598579 RepID=A0A5C1AD02_9BACT|nr:hypothetical protein [Limnoglobus roseus]QEL15876.1 hypothetical protein PX52LOC_02812 [Limnoglobus roseus]
MTPDDLADRAAECTEQFLAFVRANGLNGAVIARLSFHLDAADAGGIPFVVTPAGMAPADDSPLARGLAGAAFVGATVGRIHELFGVAACRPAHLLKLNGLNDELNIDDLAPIEVHAVEMIVGYRVEAGVEGAKEDRWDWQTGEPTTQPAFAD